MISDKLQRANPEGPRNEHPILAGLVAFVAVVVVVAGVVGVAALIGSRALGFSDDGVVDTSGSVQETLFLPRPSETDEPGTPYITLPGQTETSKPKKNNKPSKTPKPVKLISLSAAQTAVGPMEPIDLTGDYAAGEGAILRVQQFENGQWGDFPVTASVSGGRFSTFIQTGNPGLNRFRVIDTDTGEASNEIKVQIG
ncbi:hypothetical protein [Nocardioides sp.]|uniref:hypothetical protein n=1 Tax=Nocardioides sp. TaxID=35761 RepID=UPI002B270ED9|nr:hypothetical protein [Nocardioides sp.]